MCNRLPILIAFVHGGENDTHGPGSAAFMTIWHWLNLRSSRGDGTIKCVNRLASLLTAVPFAPYNAEVRCGSRAGGSEWSFFCDRDSKDANPCQSEPINRNEFPESAPMVSAHG